MRSRDSAIDYSISTALVRLISRCVYLGEAGTRIPSRADTLTLPEQPSALVSGPVTDKVFPSRQRRAANAPIHGPQNGG